MLYIIFQQKLVGAFKKIFKIFPPTDSSLCGFKVNATFITQFSQENIFPSQNKQSVSTCHTTFSSRCLGVHPKIFSDIFHLPIHPHLVLNYVSVRNKNYIRICHRVFSSRTPWAPLGSIFLFWPLTTSNLFLNCSVDNYVL